MNKRERENLKIIEEIRNGGSEKLEEIYIEHRESFMRWSSWKYNLSHEDILDAYQDAIIILYRNIMSGRLSSIQSSVKTYLFAIGNNLLLKNLEFTRRIYFKANISDGLIRDFDMSIYTKYELDHRKQVINSGLNKLSKICRRIIIHFYYHQYSLEAIQEEMNYKSLGVVSTQKSRCLHKLRLLVKKQLSTV